MSKFNSISTNFGLYEVPKIGQLVRIKKQSRLERFAADIHDCGWSSSMEDFAGGTFQIRTVSERKAYHVRLEGVSDWWWSTGWLEKINE